MYSILSYLLTGGAFLFLSCEKQSFPEAVNDLTPVFFIAGAGDEQVIDLAGGVDDYYMFTDFQYDTIDNRYIFQGILSYVNCLDCPQTLFIEVADSLRRANGSTFAESIPLVSQTYPFSLPIEQAGIQLRFSSSVPEEEAEAYSWDFGDGNQSSLRNPRHIFSLNNQSPHVITHRVTRIDECVSEVQKEAETDTLNDESCSINFSIQQFNPDSISFVNESSAIDNAEYEWRVELYDSLTDSIETEIGTSNILYEVLLDSNSSFILQSVTLTQTQGPCMGSITKTFGRDTLAPDPDPVDNDIFCDLDFTQERESILVPTPSLTSDVRVSWISEDGTLYSSDKFGQPSNSFFQINSVTPFEVNERGLATFKAQINFSCEVYNANGETISLSNMEGVFGFAFP